MNKWLIVILCLICGVILASFGVARGSILLLAGAIFAILLGALVIIIDKHFGG
jgi:hypothetical protein